MRTNILRVTDILRNRKISTVGVYTPIGSLEAVCTHRFRTGGIMRSVFATLCLCVVLLACGSPKPPMSARAPTTDETVTYEQVTIPSLVMTKPDGKLVRTSGAWGGVQPNIAGVAPDAFGVHFYDGATIIALSVPRTLASQAERFTHGQAVTVEGRFEDRTPFPLVHVDRFVETSP